MQPTPEGQKIQVRVSHYWPPLGGPNCAVYIGEPPNGKCVSKVWEGTQDWENWIGKNGIACPPEWELGTKLIIEEETWTCMDRGGAIVFQDGVPWIDMLRKRPLVPYGTIIEAYKQNP